MFNAFGVFACWYFINKSLIQKWLGCERTGSDNACVRATSDNLSLENLCVRTGSVRACDK